MFRTITKILNSDALTDNIVATIFTGTGTYYSSGLEFHADKLPNVAAIKEFISALINYPKLLISIVNGPAIGIGAATLPLFDIVYASNQALFSTPFIHYGFTLEGCSSYLFPRIMGKSKAMEMLLLGETITAEDALNSNLISKIIPDEKINKLFEKLTTLEKLPLGVIQTTKKLLNVTLKDKLNEFHDKEITAMEKVSKSSAYSNAVEKFKLRKKTMAKVSSENILLFLKNGVRIIKINRPKLRNAINESMLHTITSTLNSDALNNDIVATIFTGSETYYSSGLELQVDKLPNIVAIKEFISALINHPKLLITVVNGPAIGIAAMILPLFDIVYASNYATLSTPFIHNGFSPEACSSYLFPRIMGKSKAMEMFLLGEPITAEDALNFNLISEIVAHEKLDQLFEKLVTIGKLPLDVVQSTKKLMNVMLKDKLNALHEKEMALIDKSLQSNAFLEFLRKFKSRKSKL
ncbi:hypothetical protein RN001_010005 [Aquatica leii]|uniref:Enoyl-CoA delta isomerase 2, mitochondrial n=1 Tax=Aquatica leii TaxID=1421715 RepID=A0AAN7SFW1_9COLE|nr:hypothetical protein RN001_010005 [Aquatica leii]